MYIFVNAIYIYTTKFSRQPEHSVLEPILFLDDYSNVVFLDSHGSGRVPESENNTTDDWVTENFLLLINSASREARRLVRQ